MDNRRIEVSQEEALTIAARGTVVFAMVPAGSGSGWGAMQPSTLQELLKGCIFFAKEAELIRDLEEDEPEEPPKPKPKKTVKSTPEETTEFLVKSVEAFEEKAKAAAGKEKNTKVKIQQVEGKKAHDGAKMPKPEHSYEAQYKPELEWTDEMLAVLGALRYDAEGKLNWTLEQLARYFGCSDTQEITDSICVWQTRKEELKPLAETYEYMPKAPVGHPRYKPSILQRKGEA